MVRRLITTRDLVRPIQAALFLFFGFVGGVGSAATSSIEQNGIRVDFSVQPVDDSQARLTAASDAAFRFSISDISGALVAGAYPAAWMQRRAETQPTDKTACQKMIKTFIEGSLITQPTLNLNVYYVLVLNDDATISVVDPLFQFGGTNLLTMIPLSSKGYDWRYSQQLQRLLVTLPDARSLAFVDTIGFNVSQEIDLGVRPGTVALQPDQQYAWVGYSDDQSGGVIVVDIGKGKVVNRIESGRGNHRFAFSPDSRYAFVTNEYDDTVSVIDVHQLQNVQTIATAERPVSIDYSSAADAVYVSHAGDGSIVSIGAKTLKVNSRTILDPGLGQIRFAPGGRFAVVVNPATDHAYVWDAAKDRVTKSGKVEVGPDQVSYSDTLAYIRHRGSATVLMIPMEVISDPDVDMQVVDFPGGQRAFGIADSPAPSIVQAPGENAVLVAHPIDRQVYYYKEGMAAPMGSFRNYRRSARAVLAVDRSLQEVIPGNYATTGRLAEAGTYDVAFFMDSPRVTHCFEVLVMPNLHNPTPTVKSTIVSLIPNQQFKVGETNLLRFRLQDSVSGDPVVGIGQIQALAVLSPGIWQTRPTVKEEGDGIYAFEWIPPEAGAYFVHLNAAWKEGDLEAPDQLMFRVD